MFWFYRVECIEFLSRKRSGVVLIDSAHEEDQTAKQGLCQRNRNDKELIT